MERLPVNSQTILSASSANLSELSKLADKIAEIREIPSFIVTFLQRYTENFSLNLSYFPSKYNLFLGKLKTMVLQNYTFTFTFFNFDFSFIFLIAIYIVDR